MFFEGYPQPWRGWLLALTALIFALIIVQFGTAGSNWVITTVILALIVIQFGLIRYVRRRL